MTAPAKRTSGTTPNPAVAARRIRFVAEPPDGAKVLRRFPPPRGCAAVEGAPAFPARPGRAGWPGPSDPLGGVPAPPGAAGGWGEPAPAWLAPPDHPEAPPAVAVE